MATQPGRPDQGDSLALTSLTCLPGQSSLPPAEPPSLPSGSDRAPEVRRRQPQAERPTDRHETGKSGGIWSGGVPARMAPARAGAWYPAGRQCPPGLRCPPGTAGQKGTRCKAGAAGRSIRDEAASVARPTAWHGKGGQRLAPRTPSGGLNMDRIDPKVDEAIQTL